MISIKDPTWSIWLPRAKSRDQTRIHQQRHEPRLRRGSDFDDSVDLAIGGSGGRALVLGPCCTKQVGDTEVDLNMSVNQEERISKDSLTGTRFPLTQISVGGSASRTLA
jgi:hypothetical protein